ncbi:MAG: TonB-dependent receptor plug domain-containing protein [Opitutaceae bacterium]|nr:TonB-dependent receptor plug domain-containing protein [Opitutaceae bacterium]
MRLPSAQSLPLFLSLLLLSSASAQTITPAPAKAADGTVTLSPFEVRAEDDTGYQAMNTTSGSRLATSLRDTAAAISPFTPEFLSDIAATNITEMLAYAANAELNAGDSEGAGFNNPRDFNSAGGEPFRIRGIPGGVSTDYVENAAPQDLYNIERAEVASGANSILFGSGDAGGLVSLSSKRANVARNKYSAQAVFGSWDYERYTTDLNQVIVPRTLAVRINALYGNAKAWRRYEFNDTQRATGAVTYKPFARTTLSANYESGRTANSAGVKWNTTDQATRWINAGRAITDATVADPARGIINFGTNQRFTFFTGDGFVSNLRTENRSSILPGTADTLISPTIFPYDINWAGPSSRLQRTFNNWQVSLEHRFTETFTVQAIYLKNQTRAKARSFVFNTSGGNTMDLFGDPNLTIPAPSGTGTIPNPRAGQLYLESNNNRDFTDTDNDIKRVMAAYELKLGKMAGLHRFAGMFERARQDRHTGSQREILIDQANRPVSNATPENAQNLLWRRSYLKEGDYDTYALLGLYTPLAPFTYNGLTLNARPINTGELFAVKETDSIMLAAQSSWLNGLVTSTLGYRRDDIVYLDSTSGRVTSATDPRVTSGQMLLNEVVALPGYGRNTFTADTLTAGGVLHFSRRFSVFYNQSTNHGAPRFDRRILPDGRIPPPPEGETRDIGFMLDPFGDDRFFLRASYFETAQIGDAAVSPSGAVTNAAALGRSQTLAVNAAFVAAGRMTQAQADAAGFNWNAAIIDTKSRGYEVEMVANPTRQWTIRANYSRSSRDRENFFAEGYTFFAQKFTEWRALAAGNAALLATVETNITAIQNNELDGRAVAQEQGFGSIPHKATVTSRYRFSEGRLKGAFVGGAVRYQSGAFSQTDTRAATAGGTGRNYFTEGTLFTDAFVGYPFRLPWQPKVAMRVQLNGRNIFNADLVSLARYNADFSGPRRIYLREPRSWRLTVAAEF